MLSKLRAYAELMRVANVFTAISNVWMGMIVATGGLPGWMAVGISAASACLYLAGMVLNDVFDHQLDAVERPERPIPSGRVSLSQAAWLGWGLLLSGVAIAWVTASVTGNTAIGGIASLLAAVVVLYDVGKVEELAAVLMCLCRALNVGLGMSVAGITPGPPDAWPILLGVGLYIASVTLFARNEANESHRRQLAWCTAGIALSLTIIAATPALSDGGFERLRIDPAGWWILWIVVAGTILRRLMVAVLQPSPKFVQRAVGHAILSIIVIDAAICLGFASPFWALAVLALLAPAALLAQFLKVT